MGGPERSLGNTRVTLTQASLSQNTNCTMPWNVKERMHVKEIVAEGTIVVNEGYFTVWTLFTGLLIRDLPARSLGRVCCERHYSGFALPHCPPFG